MATDVPLAHSAGPDGRPQPLVDHLVAVADLASSRAAKLGAATLGYWAGLWHDLGKFSRAFQAYVRQPRGAHGPDHSSAGAVLAAEIQDLVAFPVAGHHAGLPARSNLIARLRERRADPIVRDALERAADALPALRPQGSLLTAIPVFALEAGSSGELFIRMLFSALVDADSLDTEGHFTPDRAATRTHEVSLAALWDCLAADQNRLAEAAPSRVNVVRRAVYEQCVNAADRPQGVFRLTLPTGGGKTRSSLAFALRHAVRHGLDRVIVAIPYTSIIDQTADVYRGILGADAVLEHHSAIEPTDPDDVHPDWSELATENWDAPLVVTTTVQLFESLFSNRRARCRRLHNIARSVIVLDEVQTLPPHLLTPILDVLKDLAAHYRVTVVLCTATQPALAAGPYIDGFHHVEEIVERPARYFHDLQRVRYERPIEPWTWAQVAAGMQAEEQVLTVVNTKRDAQALLDALGDPGVLHLSTLLCGADRRRVLHDVRERLLRGGPCRLVSTQVIEAGVDVDFPVVFRAMGPLDRIVQAAGRCNREGRLEEGRVVVFEPADGGMPRGAYRTGADTARSLLGEEDFDFHDPRWYERYFARLYQARDLDEKGIQALRAAYDFQEVAARFRLIDDNTVPVVVPYRGSDGTERVVDDLLRIARNTLVLPRDTFRRLQPYVVQMWRRDVDAHERAGRIRLVRPGLWEWAGGYEPGRGPTAAGFDPENWIV